ncbi:MAG: hypothetical protein KF870_10650 [Leadbetterella sp.]|nr:hypothetical protein [Leadbetterella sp.]
MKRFIFFIFLSCTATAQLREVAEVTLMLPEGINESIEVVPVNDDILLVNLQEDYLRREQKVVVVKYNPDLELTWTGNAVGPRFYEPVSFVVSGQSLYYLFKEKEGKKLHLMQFDLENEIISAFDFESITVLENIGFTVFNGKPLISGIYNLKPVVEMHNLKEKTAKVLPDIYNKNNELKGIFLNPYRDELYVFSSLRNNCQMQVATYDDDGKLLFRRGLGDKKHRVKQFEVRLGPNGEPYVLGTYNSSCLDMTEGLVTGSLDLPQSIRYHSIAGLPGYRASLSDKKRRRLQLRKERGKGEVRQKAIFHVPVSAINGFLLATEFYNMQSTSRATAQVEFSDATGRTVHLSEFKVWRILLAELDTEGNVTYDRLFKLEGDGFRRLTPQSAFLFKNEEFYAFLPSGNKLIYTGSGKVESHLLFKTGEGIRVTDTDTRLFNLSSSTFIAHGTADIRPVASEGTSQQIYFIKKLQFQ